MFLNLEIAVSALFCLHQQQIAERDQQIADVIKEREKIQKERIEVQKTN